MACKSQIKKRNLEQYDHKGKERVNNPPVGLVSPETDKDAPKKNYQYDPHLDPQLVWAGKVEHTSFEVPTVSLHVHERIDPRTIIEAVCKKNGVNYEQLSLFGSPEENPPLRNAVEFYKHKHNWTNRLIAGDSLLIMNSLLEKEGMSGKVQMIYMDPPYGIKYGSNFQPFVHKRDVKDGKDEDLTSEPEMIKAFRDTWELGIHSYLTYMRDRLLLAKQLLHESGSVFVQISDENVHLVRNLMDEIFGVNNFVSLIMFKTTSGLGRKLLDKCGDYILWYSRNIEQIKYRQMYQVKTDDNITDSHKILLANSEVLSIKQYEKRFLNGEKIGLAKLKDGERIFNYGDVKSQSGNGGEVIINGKKYTTTMGSWKTTEEGFNNLYSKGRIRLNDKSFNYIRYFDDFSFVSLTNMWSNQLSESDKDYVVQTSTEVIKRCLLMTTDPGDLVLDPTCGSGTTAYVAEQWGRRWITCDTSRVALTLAKQRIMTALYDYYQLAHPDEGVGSGFVYKTVPHITLKSIANNEPPAQETLYDRPFIDNSKARVTGPFTVEAVPAPIAKSLDELEKTEQASDISIARSGETLRQSEWRDELLNNGVRGKGGQYIKFSRVEPMSGTRYIQAEAETKAVESDEGLVESEKEITSDSSLPTHHSSLITTHSSSKRVFIVFGPEYAPMEQRQVSLALDEAQSLRPKADMILFAAFQFDPEAAKDIDETKWAGVTLLRVQMNADLFTDDLKKKRTSDDSFWLLGQPDVRVLSLEFLVFSNDRRLCEYETFKKLSGFNSLAEINGLGEQDIQYYALLSQGRDLWHYLSDEKGWDFNTGKYCGRSGKEQQRGIPSVSWDCTRLISGIRNFDTDLSEFGIHSIHECRRVVEQLRRDSKIIGSIKEIINELKLPLTKNSKLTTKNFSQVEVKGFDYYDTKTGNVVSGSEKNIAMWMLDTDYNGRSLFPRQVFFPMASETEGWSKLAKNLKAEIDSQLIEAYRGTVSLPFSAGEYKRCAVKIIDDRGIESLRIIEV